MRILVSALTLLLAACSTHTVRHVDITVAPESVTVRAPSYIAVGDSLTVRVKDRQYSNRYEARPTEGTLTAMARAPLFGATDLQKITLRFQPSRTPANAEAFTPAFNLSFIDGGRLSRSDAEAVAEEAQAVEAELVAVSTRFRERLDSLRVVVASDPTEFARLRLLVDDSWTRAAQVVVAHPAPEDTEQLLTALASGQMDSIPPEHLEQVRRNAESYALRLDALRALLPANPPAGGGENSRVGELLEALGEDLAAYKELDQRAGALWAAARVTQPARTRSGQLPMSTNIAGIDIGPWLMDPDQLSEDLDAIHARIALVNQQTERLVLSLNQLPAWTRTSGRESIFTQLFPSEKEVKVVVVRQDRYERFAVTAPTAAATPPAKKEGAAAGTSGLSVTTTTTVTTADGTEDSAGGGENAAAAGGSGGQPVVLTAVTPPRMDTVAVVNIPVLQRFRFHLGVGMVYSTLKTGVFQTPADTSDGVPGVRVVRTGTDENRLLPMAMLSYTVHPFGGRYVDGRAYRRLPILAPNVSVQAGMSLSDPTEHLYAGLSAEFFPGLDIGVGRHFGYVQTTTREGEFVPLTQMATSNRWRDDWAYSLTLDAQTFLSTFGKVLGLK